ncbi:MAG TPA: hypothetical protein VIK78_08895 [Ruminiclostridium sp.]
MNMKLFLKRLSIAILIGIGLGVPIGLVATLFTEEQLEIIIPIFALIIVTVLIWMFTYTILKFIKFNKEVIRLLKILYEETNAEKYIIETKATISKTKNKLYKLHFSLNLAAGYEANGDYQKAIDHIKGLNINNASGIYKALYYNNLAFFYFETDDFQSAIQTFLEGEKFTSKRIENSNFSGALLHTKGIIEYAKGNLTSSEELLERSKLQVNANNHLVTSANLYLAKICLQTSRIQKARLLLDYNLLQKLLPNILSETKKVLAEMESTNDTSF